MAALLMQMTIILLLRLLSRNETNHSRCGPSSSSSRLSVVLGGVAVARTLRRRHIALVYCILKGDALVMMPPLQHSRRDQIASRLLSAPTLRHPSIQPSPLLLLRPSFTRNEQTRYIPYCRRQKNWLGPRRLIPGFLGLPLSLPWTSKETFITFDNLYPGRLCCWPGAQSIVSNINNIEGARFLLTQAALSRRPALTSFTQTLIYHCRRRYGRRFRVQSFVRIAKLLRFSYVFYSFLWRVVFAALRQSISILQLTEELLHLKIGKSFFPSRRWPCDFVSIAFKLTWSPCYIIHIRNT